MSLVWLLACTSSGDLLREEQRPLGAVTLGAETWSFTADLRRWRYSAGFRDDEGFTAGHERTYVSWRLTTAKGRVRGDADHTWAFDDPDEAARFHAGLDLTTCVAKDRAAFRVGDGPWSWLVAVGPGGAVGLVERDAATCEEALQAWPSAEAWLTDAVAQRDVCAHLTHLRRRPDALRCLLRQSSDTPADVAHRVDLPNAVNDPGFDEDLLAVLVDTPPAAAGFAPYRVTALVPELDATQKATLADALRKRTRPLLPWEVALLASLDPAAAAGLPLSAGTVEARLAAAALALPPDHPWWTPATLPAAWVPPGMPPGPGCAATVRGAPDRCP